MRRVLLGVLLALAACGGDDGPTTNFELSGTWESSAGGTETIDDTRWTAGNLSTLVIEFDNEANVAITQNPTDGGFAPGTFNRVVWTEPEEDGFFYCPTDVGLETREDAQAADTPADDTDPVSTGCGGLAWIQLTPP